MSLMEKWPSALGRFAARIAGMPARAESVEAANRLAVPIADTPTRAERPLPEDAIAIIPMRNTVLFPGAIAPLTIGRESSVAAAQEAVKTERRVGFLLQRDPAQDQPGPEGLYAVGTAGQIARYITGSQGAHHLIVQGQARFRVVEFLPGWPYTVARVAFVDEPAETGSEIEARFIQLKGLAIEAIKLLPNAPAELAEVVQAIDAPPLLADMVANLLDIKPEEKQSVLESFALRVRLDRVLEFISSRVEVLRLSHEIGEKTKKEFDSRQREHVLREQLRQIQKELGEGEDTGAEIEEIRKAIELAGMPEDVGAHAQRELKRLARMHEASGESSMLRTYLEWLSELPWKPEPATAIDIAGARRVLDEDHYGLEKVKRRILEYLAVRKLSPEGKSPILCFVGPPGVGKTSLGQSIARATGRRFQRVALGGLHDEAEIRGHRRTYIGALPGNIIQAVRRAESRNALIMLDEIDKVGAGGFQGDPASALLEVLDPEQNSKFRDNYLGVDFDLSRILFITTANVLDTVPGPLRDRMEVITLPGYTEEEKLEIAKRYLVGRQRAANGLKPGQASVTDAALSAIIRDHTREAGVRNLEREIGAVLRSVAMKIAEGMMAEDAPPAVIDAPDLHAILGPRKFEMETALRAGIPGVATGLAWTPVGGDILFIEAAKIEGAGKLMLTGQLGEVMKESAQAALTLARARLGGPFDKIDVHVHVPAGATPKDGPSAGVAMYLALMSLFTGRPVKSDVAMTGEISLRGLVLPVGGIKEKALAALRAGIRTVLLPRRNEKDLEDIPPAMREQIRFVFLDTVDDAVAQALQTPEPAAA